MELRHLRYFVAVAEALSFTRAAERLHIAQPPLSMQIRALEEELGAALFHRTKRRVSLTAAGHAFLLRARQILADAETARDEVGRAARGELGRLRIGFTSSLPYSPAFGDVLRAYRAACPAVDVQLREMFTGDQFDALRRDALDVALVRQPAESAPEGVTMREIGRDPLRIVTHTAHRLAAAGAVSMADLRDEAFITFPSDAGTGLPAMLARLCREAGFEPRVVQIAREATTQISLAVAGLGLALLPAPLECVKLPRACYLPIRDIDAAFPLCVATASGAPNPVVAGFLAVLDAVTAQAGGVLSR